MWRSRLSSYALRSRKYGTQQSFRSPINRSTSKEDGFQQVKTLSQLLINKAARGKTGAKPRSLDPLSSRKQSDNDWSNLVTDPADMTKATITTPVGTFVELRRSDSISDAVIISAVDSREGFRPVVLTSQGTISVCGEQDIMLSIPSYVDEHLANRCGSDENPTPEQLKARVEVLRKLRDIETATDSLANLVSTRSQNLYETFRSRDPDQWSQLTTAAAVRIIDSRASISPPTLIAMHKYLMEHSLHFVAHPTSHRYTHQFLVRPQSHVDSIESVVAWRRDQRGDGVLEKFIKKAQRIIAESRRLQDESRNDPPSVVSKALGDLVFDANDKVILRFLYDALQIKRIIQPNPYTVSAGYILKQLGEDPGVNGTSFTLRRILTDLGVFTPWENIPETAASVELLANKPKDKRAPPISPSAKHQPLGPDDLYPTDLVDSVRHDFGDMSVYVIDDATAEELDDGVSVESVPSDPECTWVHIHVADPTRILPPTHKLAIQARYLSESTYYNHGSQAMLPSDSTFSSISLGKASAEGRPEYVMTFSAKIDKEGFIVDYKVRAGIIRNIKIITYDDVDRLLNIPAHPPSYPFLASPPSPVSCPVPELNSSDIDRLSSLHGVALQLVKNRTKLPAISFTSPMSVVSFASKDLPSAPSLNNINEVNLFSGFPRMTYSVDSSESTLYGSRMMITELMKVACRVASRFGVDQGVPLIHRSGEEACTTIPEDLGKLLASRDEHGLIDMFAARKARLIIPRVVHTLQPKQHWTMGIPEGEGYVRATSPLRRYADLVTHWQIKQALLDPTAPSTRKSLFPEDWMAELANELTLRGRDLKRQDTLHNAYWCGLYLQRWFRGLLPTNLDPQSTFTAKVGSQVILNHDTGVYRADVLLPVLGIWASLWVKSLDKIGEIGSEHQVKFSSIKLNIRPEIVVGLV